MRPRWPGNRGGGRHARGARTLAGHTIWVVSAAMAITCGIVVMTPTGGAVRLATRMADAAGTPPRQAPDAPPAPTDGRSFNGTPAVGALFTVSGGQLGRHFCTASVVDSPWQASKDPDHDVAFLVVHRTGSGDRIQDLTGGEQLGIGWSARAWVNVIGYPDGTDRPISCQNESKPLGAREMEFDCGGYTNGTSGGPFLGRVNASTGEGTVIGVIGG